MVTEEQMKSALAARRRIERWKGKVKWRILTLLGEMDAEVAALVGSEKDLLTFQGVDAVDPRRGKAED